MKQRISFKQLHELTPDQRHSLRDMFIYRWGWLGRVIPFFPFSIGQMIDILYQQECVIICSEERESPMMGWQVNNKYYSTELVDALWEAFKAML